MKGTVKLEVVTPEKTVVDEDVQIVMAPGTLGEVGILIGHTPFLTTLKLGMLHYNDVGGTERFVYVNGGFLEALPDRVTVLAESAERRGDIDKERAQAALERSRKRLAGDSDQEDIDFKRARAALERALIRLKIVETKMR